MEAALAADVAEIIVVTGHEPQRVIDALAGLPVRHLLNEAYASGLAGSIRVGLSATHSADGVLILLGDMPLVSTELLRALMQRAACMSEKWAIVPVHAGQWGNPVLLLSAGFGMVSGIDGDKGLRAILMKHRDLIDEMETDDTSILVDIDTPETLAALAEGNT